MNAHLNDRDGNTGTNSNPLGIHQLPYASNTILTTETNYQWLQGGRGNRVQVRHVGKLNITWVDGHVSSNGWTELKNNGQWVEWFKQPAISTYGGTFKGI